MKRYDILSLSLSVVLMGACALPALSDRGFMTVLIEPSQDHKVVDDLKYFEPNQNAIIAFDGEEEILFLTTNASANHAVKVLEVLPLPSRPTVTEGKIETLNTAVEVLNSKFAQTVHSGDRAGYGKGFYSSNLKAPTAVIVEHDKLGPHDVNVVEVLNKDKFVEWTESNLRKLGASSATVPEAVKTKIAKYTASGFNWFAFDVVDLSTKSTTISPLRYRFRTNKLFYPLKITKVHGSSAVKLIVMTSQPVKSIDPIKDAIIQKATASYPLHKEELIRIDPEMNKLLDKIPSFERPHIQLWQLNNPNGKDYTGDLFARF